MRLDEIAGKNSGDSALFIERDIDEKALADSQCDVAHLLPNRVPLVDAESRIWIGDMMGAVIAHHSLEPRDTWHDAFRSTAETGEEMRLDEAGNNAHIRLDQRSINKGL